MVQRQRSRWLIYSHILYALKRGRHVRPLSGFEGSINYCAAGAAAGSAATFLALCFLARCLVGAGVVSAIGAGGGGGGGGGGSGQNTEKVEQKKSPTCAEAGAVVPASRATTPAPSKTFRIINVPLTCSVRVVNIRDLNPVQCGSMDRRMLCTEKLRALGGEREQDAVAYPDQHGGAKQPPPGVHPAKDLVASPYPKA